MSGVWHRNACRLLELGSKIDRASSEEEENRLCDERDKILSFFRKLDEIVDGAPEAPPKVRTP